MSTASPTIQRKRKILVTVFFCLIGTTLSAQPARTVQPKGTTADIKQLTSEAQQITKTYIKTLKKTLQSSIIVSGPASTIQVCSLNAPAIEQSLGAQSGWHVARTSEKIRNPNNRPDFWEQNVLRNFAIRHNKGAPISALQESAIVNLNGKKAFRYMKAIPVGSLCLTCHGSKISGTVRTAINDRYPGDQAKGYRKGDLRGAFTLYKYLDEPTTTGPNSNYP